MGLEPTIEGAAEALASAIPTRISMGRLRCGNGSPIERLFLLMAGIGLDAKIVYNLSLPLKARVGKLAYWVGGFSMLGKSWTISKCR